MSFTLWAAISACVDCDACHWRFASITQSPSLHLRISSILLEEDFALHPDHLRDRRFRLSQTVIIIFVWTLACKSVLWCVQGGTRELPHKKGYALFRLAYAYKVIYSIWHFGESSRAKPHKLEPKLKFPYHWSRGFIHNSIRFRTQSEMWVDIRSHRGCL